MQFVKKPVGEMSENVRLFGAVDGTGINCQWSQQILHVLACTLSNYRAPYTDIKRMACSFMPFLHSLNKEHSLGTYEGQANEMLVLPIFSMHKWARSHRQM